MEELMDISSSSIYQHDLKKVSTLLDLEKLWGKSILITGAGGLICSAIVDLLLWCNRNLGSSIKVYAAGRNVNRLRTRFSRYTKLDNLFITAYDATQKAMFEFNVDFIIHGASNATPNAYVSHPVDTILSNVLGIHELLQYSLCSSVSKIVYISSSEVYGKQIKKTAFSEKDYGAVDLLNVRSSYPIAKQATETLCISYVKQFACNISIVRPGHIYGPTATPNDTRISSTFARQAARGQEITLKSDGKQLRSYCYCLDCATAILKVLTKGEVAHAYNISNKASIISIKEMATLLAQYGQVELKRKIATVTEQALFNPMENSSLDASKLEALGWRGLFDAKEGFSHTVHILTELYE